MELLEMRDQLCRRDWPDPILQAVSGLLTRAWYDQEDQCFTAPTHQGRSGIILFAREIMVCLMGISHSARGSCLVLTLLKQHQPKLADILEKGSESDKEYTTELLLSLCTHACTQCTDREWITELSNQDVAIEGEKDNLEVIRL
eukprot:GHVR01116494.1.p1 GENE.GHVR01116494.1~~GHVR01116494.1.p1  ORF type:complete len:161 (+),score=6.92 GHVR01116494.1:52-483(+)